MKILALTLAALSLNCTWTAAWAAGDCKAQFKRNLEEIQRRSRAMKPACWREVQKGEANTPSIMATCDDRETDLAQAMETFEKRNVALCTGSCSGELNAVKVCVDGKSLGYYLSKLTGR